VIIIPRSHIFVCSECDRTFRNAQLSGRGSRADQSARRAKKEPQAGERTLSAWGSMRAGCLFECWTPARPKMSMRRHHILRPSGIKVRGVTLIPTRHGVSQQQVFRSAGRVFFSIASRMLAWPQTVCGTAARLGVLNTRSDTGSGNAPEVKRSGARLSRSRSGMRPQSGARS
jgi:hypothetical protein